VAEDEDLCLEVSLVTPRGQSEDATKHHIKGGRTASAHPIGTARWETNRGIGTPQAAHLIEAPGPHDTAGPTRNR